MVGKPYSLARPAAALVSLLIGGCFPAERPVASNMACGGDICACTGGFGNCDGNPNNGCETDLGLDARHCGSCGIRCDNGQCVDGACEPARDFANCNESWSDGFEAHLASDPRHCGQCDHDCLGGICTGSRCAPFRLIEPGLWLDGLVTDDAYLYFCEWWAGAIMRVSQAGGVPEIISVDHDCSGHLATAGGSLYWSESSGASVFGDILFEASVDGGDTRVIAMPEDVVGLTAEGDVVAWLDNREAAPLSYVDHVVARVGAASTPTDIHQGIEFVPITTMTVLTGKVYWAEFDDLLGESYVYGLDASGGTPELLVTVDGRRLSSLAGLADELYWVETPIYAVDPDDIPDFSIVRLDLQQGTETDVVEAKSETVMMRVDAAGVYWTENAGNRLLFLAAPGGSAETVLLADYQEIDELALSPTAVFWYDDPGKLLAMAK